MGATASSFCPWEAEARLDVYLLNIRDAAAPGPKGLLSPLLQRYQAGTVGLEIFGLPAVQAVIRHKWGLRCLCGFGAWGLRCLCGFSAWK